jgi:hypothetical protein
MRLSLVFSEKAVCKLLIFLAWVQEVPGSNPGGPTKRLYHLHPSLICGTPVWSPLGVPFAQAHWAAWARVRFWNGPTYVPREKVFLRMGSKGVIFEMLSSLEEEIGLPYIEDAHPVCCRRGRLGFGHTGKRASRLKADPLVLSWLRRRRSTSGV